MMQHAGSRMHDGCYAVLIRGIMTPLGDRLGIFNGWPDGFVSDHIEKTKFFSIRGTSG